MGISALSESDWNFIEANWYANINDLMLKYAKLSHYPSLLQELLTRQKLFDKHPEWARNPSLRFQNSLSAEQCSSWLTARAKARFIQNRLAQKSICIDLTMGLGVDTSYWAELFEQVYAVERQQELISHVRANFEALSIDNCTFYEGDASVFLAEYTHVKANLIYIDPARRHETGRKAFHFSDCSPNVVEMLPNLLSRCELLLIKAATFLDISEAMAELNSPTEVLVIALKNECKEVLYLCGQNVQHGHCSTLNILNEDEVQSFDFEREAEKNLAPVSVSAPQKYIYDPNPAIMKAGAFKTIAAAYGLAKLHTHTHIYTSEILHHSFPGRIYLLKGVLKVEKSPFLPIKASVLLRNTPLSVADVRKRTQVQEGGLAVLLAAKLMNNEQRLLWLEPLEIAQK